MLKWLNISNLKGCFSGGRAMKKKVLQFISSTLFTLLFSSIIMNVFSQFSAVDENFQENEGENWAYDLAIDHEGNCYVMGVFESLSIQFGDATNQVILYNKGEESTYDIFLVKYLSDGSLDWAKSMGGKWNDGTKQGDLAVAGVDIATDKLGNVYVTGMYTSDNIIFGEGNNQVTLYNTEEAYSLFIAKYASNGTLIWAKGVEGYAYGKSIEVDDDGNCYVTGQIYWNATFGEDDKQITLSTSDYGIFVNKYNTDGTLNWAVAADGLQVDVVSDIELDANGNICIAGFFKSEEISFGEPGNEITILKDEVENINYDVFIAKYNNNGEVLWVSSIYGEGIVDGSNFRILLSSDNKGNFYSTGHFDCASVTFGEGGNQVTFTNQGERDVYLAKYQADGTLGWAETISGTSVELAYAMAKNANDAIYVSGVSVSPELIFGAGENPLTIKPDEEALFCYIAKYGAEAELSWVRLIKSVWITGLKVHNNHYYFAGIFGGASLTLGEGDNQITLYNHFSSDILVAKYNDDGTLVWANTSTGAVGSNATWLYDSGVVLYPNPSTGLVQIKLANTKREHAKIECYNLFGQLVYNVNVGCKTNHIENIRLPGKGVYLLKLQLGESIISNKLMVK